MHRRFMLGGHHRFMVVPQLMVCNVKLAELLVPARLYVQHLKSVLKTQRPDRAKHTRTQSCTSLELPYSIQIYVRTKL